MSLLDRIAAKIAIQRRCVLKFPCPRCDADDAFDGAGCRILATSALAGMIPSATEHDDDDQRAGRVEHQMNGTISAERVIEVVELWIDEALMEVDE